MGTLSSSLLILGALHPLETRAVLTRDGDKFTECHQGTYAWVHASQVYMARIHLTPMQFLVLYRGIVRPYRICIWLELEEGRKIYRLLRDISLQFLPFSPQS